MAEIECIGVMKAKDDKNNVYLLYPVTKVNAVEGLAELVNNLTTNKATIGGEVGFGGIHIGGGMTAFPYIYSENNNINFRYKDANGNDAYTNIREIITNIWQKATLGANASFPTIYLGVDSSALPVIVSDGVGNINFRFSADGSTETWTNLAFLHSSVTNLMNNSNGYITGTDVNNLLGSYITRTEVNNLLGSYCTDAEFQEGYDTIRGNMVDLNQFDDFKNKVVKKTDLGTYRFSGNELRSSEGVHIIPASGKDTYLYGVNIQCRPDDSSGTYSPIYASAFVQNSSIRFKENLVDITEDEAKNVLNVNTYHFDYKNGLKNQSGCIAEEVQKIYPELVNVDEKNLPSGIDYAKFVPYLIKMLQVQQKEIDELKSLINEKSRE